MSNHADPNQPNPLSSSDADFARVTEDLIDILLRRGVIQFTDLPEAVQTKLLQRRQARTTLNQNLKLLADEGDHGMI